MGFLYNIIICVYLFIKTQILQKKHVVLTLERPSASIDAFQVFNFPYIRRISIFSAETS